MSRGAVFTGSSTLPGNDFPGRSPGNWKVQVFKHPWPKKNPGWHACHTYSQKCKRVKSQGGGRRGAHAARARGFFTLWAGGGLGHGAPSWAMTLPAVFWIPGCGATADHAPHYIGASVPAAPHGPAGRVAAGAPLHVACTAWVKTGDFKRALKTRPRRPTT